MAAVYWREGQREFYTYASKQSYSKISEIDGAYKMRIPCSFSRRKYSIVEISLRVNSWCGRNSAWVYGNRPAFDVVFEPNVPLPLEMTPIRDTVADLAASCIALS